MKLKISKSALASVPVDMLLLICCYYLSYLLRFEFSIPGWAEKQFFNTLVFVLLFKFACFYFFDVYRGMWRYTSLNDLFDILKSASFATFLIIAFVLYTTRFEGVPRSVFVIDWCLTVMGITSVRVFTRLCFEHFTEDVNLSSLVYVIHKIFSKKAGQKGKRMIIVGAGDCGQRICREFKGNPYVKSHVIGFLDDDLAKIGRKIHGVPVLNSIDNLVHTIRSMSVEEIIIAIPNAGAERMREIVALCRQADVQFKTVPDMGELIDGKITINSIRNIEYRDLLGRSPINLDKEKIGQYLSGKIVLVTGAGGSIGSGLSRQICRYTPRKLILFERAESPLYEIDLELKKSFGDIEIIPVLGDVQDRDEVCKVFEQQKPDIVFHAAAYKHVPMLERHSWKAVENNIIGTENMIQTSNEHGCERFVLVSTDKAVNPTNIMGASKRVAELLVQKKSNSKGVKTNFIIVRFGNVIGSVGSVIPLFKKQIQEGGPVTVTHPDIIRYFMLIPEACQLILQAGAMGKGGEIFLLEMGQPVKIDAMARDLIRLSGMEPDVDIKIEYTGLRPGEKLYEELMTDNEDVVPTGHKKILILNSQKNEVKNLIEDFKSLKDAAKNRDFYQIKKAFKKIVPEYDYNTNKD